MARANLQLISDENRLVVERWILLRALILESYAEDSKAFSRIERAKRIRKKTPLPSTSKQLQLLNFSTKLESESYKNIAIIPTMLSYLQNELSTIHEQLIRKNEGLTVVEQATQEDSYGKE